jgi:hypothetical protein
VLGIRHDRSFRSECVTDRSRRDRVAHMRPSRKGSNVNVCGGSATIDAYDRSIVQAFVRVSSMLTTRVSSRVTTTPCRRAKEESTWLCVRAERSEKTVRFSDRLSVHLRGAT